MFKKHLYKFYACGLPLIWLLVFCNIAFKIPDETLIMKLEVLFFIAFMLGSVAISGFICGKKDHKTRIFKI